MNRKLIILVAEDDPRDCELIRLALKRQAIAAEIHMVHDGEQVIDYLRHRNGFQDRQTHPFPDLLLMDFKMPKMSGLDVLEWLRRHPHCNRLPRVMLSGSGLEKDVEEAYRRGANTYFAKPSSFKEFSALLKTLVDYWSRSLRPDVSHC